MKTITTRFVPYSLDAADPKYRAICREREEAGAKLMRVYPMAVTPVNMGPERDVSLSTEFIFGDQWNSEPDAYSDKGFRMFNWYEGIVPNEDRRAGHYLVITEEMREAVRTTYKCGYCGLHYGGHDNAGRFCNRCLDSEYLKEKDLPLLRLRPCRLDGGWPDRPPLSGAEASILMPQYIEAQVKAGAARDREKKKSELARVMEKYEKAGEEYRGMLWLLDHDVPLDNVIYYEHSRTFSFGWKSPLDMSVKNRLGELLADFPYKYELKEKK